MKNLDDRTFREDAYVQLRTAMDGHDLILINSEIERTEARLAKLRERLEQQKQKKANKEKRGGIFRTAFERVLQKISMMRGDLVKNENALARLERKRGTLLRKKTKASAVYRAEYTAICAIPRVVSVVVSSTHVLVTTDELFCKNESKNTWHKIGWFVISMNLFTGNTTSIRWQNKSGIKVHDMYYSPTGIEHDGQRACLGNAQRLIEDAYNERRLVDLIALLVRFPESPGQGTWVHLFPQVDRTDVPEWYLETFD